jgi:hypothetical protein
MGVQICTGSAPSFPPEALQKVPLFTKSSLGKVLPANKSSPEKVPLITKSSLEKKFPFSQKVPPANETTFCEKGELFKSSPYYKKFP